MWKTAVIIALAAGCASSSQPAPATPTKTKAREQQLVRLREQNEEQQQRLRELEGRIALMEAEAKEQRDIEVQNQGLAAGQTVVLSSSARADDEPTYEDEWPQSDDDAVIAEGPRPLLRLHGTPADSEPLPSAPALPLPANAADLAQVTPTEADASRYDAVAQYQAALELYIRRKYSPALRAFTAFLVEHPRHPYADNALYWRGELHYLRGAYSKALKDFAKVLKQYPSGNKAPDALLKIGYCYQRMGHQRRARAYFQKVQRHFPKSQAARTAAREGAS